MRLNTNNQNRSPPVLPKTPVVKTMASNKSKLQRQGSKPLVLRAKHIKPRQKPPKKITVQRNPIVITTNIQKASQSLRKSKIKTNVLKTRSPPKSKRPAVLPHPGRRALKNTSKLAETKAKQDRLYAQFNNKVKNLKGIGNGRVLVMVACGPSVQETPLEQIIGNERIDFMTINQPYGYYEDKVKPEHKGLWPPKYWVMCDSSQYRRNITAWNNYKGTVITSASVKGHHPDHIIIRNKSGKGFSKDLVNGYHIGRSSTYSNMQTALYMGYDKVYIFGVDMCEVGGKLHHYGVNPDVSPKNRKSRFAEEAKHYEFALQKLSKEECSRFVFCSSYNPFPFVHKYGQLDHKEAPQKILEYLNQK